jgi:hypothetical protein
MKKTDFSYAELVEACTDKDNKGKDNAITIVDIHGDECRYKFVGTTDIRHGNVVNLVNGAVHEAGIITNPDALKSWDGFSPVDSY